MKSYPKAEEIRKIPIKNQKDSIIQVSQITVEDVLDRLFIEIIKRRKAGCCSMTTNTMNPLVSWTEHNDVETIGIEVVNKLKELGFNIINYYVNRDHPEEYKGNDERLQVIGEAISFNVSFDWR